MRRLKARLLLASALVCVGVAVPRGPADAAAPPQLVSVSAPAAATVGPASAESWQLGVTSDSGSPITEVEMDFTLNGGAATPYQSVPTLVGSLTNPAPAQATTITATLTTGVWQAAGDYQLLGVELFDAAGDESHWFRNGTEAGYPASTPQPSLTAADFTVVNPHGDSNPPTITSLTSLTPVVQAGDPVLLGYTATDDISGVARVSAQYDSPSGQSLYLTAAVPGSDATGPVTALVPAHAEGGSYRLLLLSVTDNAGNNQYYIGTNGGVTTANAGFTVISGTPDTTPPRLTSLQPLAPVTSPNGYVGFNYTAADDASGVTSVTAQYVDSAGMHQFVGKNCADDTTGPAGQGLPGTDGTVFTLLTITLADGVGNEISYNRNGTINQDGSGPEQPGPGLPGFDLSLGDVTMRTGAKPPLTFNPPCPSQTTALTLTSTAGTGPSRTGTGTVHFAGVAVANPVVGIYTPASAGAPKIVSLIHGQTDGSYATGPLPAGAVAHFFGGLAGHLQAPAADTTATRPVTAVFRPRRHPHIRLTVTALGSRAHPELRLVAKVLGANRGDIVGLQQVRGRQWATLRTARLGVRGTVVFTFTLPQRNRLRLYVAQTAQHTSATASIRPATTISFAR